MREGVGGWGPNLEEKPTQEFDKMLGSGTMHICKGHSIENKKILHKEAE